MPTSSTEASQDRFIDRATALPRRGLELLPPVPLLIGVLAGFALACLAGKRRSEQPIFHDFERFYAPITVPYLFYPTASEMLAQVRSMVPKDKILVIVGGSSFFQGAGQGRDELWTLELQRLLGPRFGVVNLAMPGFAGTGDANVAFQVLSKEYPKAIYITNASPIVADPLDGSAAYSGAFWDAYYRGLLEVPASWRPEVDETIRREKESPEGYELHLGKRIDRYTYACDLWNYVGYEYLFTVWCDILPTTTTWARKRYADDRIGNFEGQRESLRNNPDFRKANEDGLRGFARNGFIFAPDGSWTVDRNIWNYIAGESAKSYPEPLHSKIYLVLVRSNPYYEQTFTADDWKRHEVMMEEGQKAHEKAGYHVIPLPESTFTEDDFVDVGHYMPSGGRKLAKVVADQVLRDYP